MKTNDARQLDHKTLTELRKRAVVSVQDGQSPETIARALGIDRRTIYGWLSRYRNGGWAALDAKKRGGRPPKLDKKVEEDLIGEAQRLRAENAYLKDLRALVLEDERRQYKKRW